MKWKITGTEELSLDSESDSLTYDPFDYYDGISKSYSNHFIRNMVYTQDQADRRLDSFARIIHEVIEKVLTYKADKLQKYLGDKQRLINQIKWLEDKLDALEQLKDAKNKQLKLDKKYARDKKILGKLEKKVDKNKEALEINSLQKIQPENKKELFRNQESEIGNLKEKIAECEKPIREIEDKIQNIGEELNELQGFIDNESDELKKN
mmetsp:Transcript_21942/g.10323  ORF Transcript_21942/g.10323 Transcript_21942/m.10323 type:complete len:208 (+) Transcript_21942:244-867(+)